MRENNTNYIAVGLLSITMLSLLFMVIYKISNYQFEGDTYYIQYKNVSGLRVGSKVSFSGYNIGSVKNIEASRLQGKTLYTVHVSVKKGWQISSGSVAKIVSPGILSDKQIDINESNAEQLHAPGDTLIGDEAVNIMLAIDSVAKEVQQISNHNLKPLINNLNTHINNISAQINNLGNNLIGGIPSLITSSDQLLQKLNFGANNIALLVSKQNQQHLSSIFQNAEEFSRNMANLSRGLEETVSRLDSLLGNSNNIVTQNQDNLRSSISELRNTLFTVSQNIDSIVYNLNTTSRNFNEFSHDIRSSPSVLLGGKPPVDQAETQ